MRVWTLGVGHEGGGRGVEWEVGWFCLPRLEEVPIEPGGTRSVIWWLLSFTLLFDFPKVIDLRDLSERDEDSPLSKAVPSRRY